MEKTLFPILALGMRYKVRRIMTIIVATAVLHNIARANADENPPEDTDLDFPMPWDDLIAEGCMNDSDNAENAVNATCIQIINEYFGR